MSKFDKVGLLRLSILNRNKDTTHWHFLNFSSHITFPSDALEDRGEAGNLLSERLLLCIGGDVHSEDATAHLFAN